MDMEGSDKMLFKQWDGEKYIPLKYCVKEIHFRDNFEKFLNSLPDNAEVIYINEQNSWFTVVVHLVESFKEEETNVDK